MQVAQVLANLLEQFQQDAKQAITEQADYVAYWDAAGAPVVQHNSRGQIVLYPVAGYPWHFIDHALERPEFIGQDLAHVEATARLLCA